MAQQVRHYHRGDQAAPNLRVAELRLRDRDGQVAHRHQTRPARDGGAVDRGDRRLGQGVDLVVQLRQA